MPFAYVAHLRTFILLWLLQLPLMFCTYCGWVTPFAMVTVVLLFLGLDSISGEIENPFGYDWNDLPLGTPPLGFHLICTLSVSGPVCLGRGCSLPARATEHMVPICILYADVIVSQLNSDIVQV